MQFGFWIGLFQQSATSLAREERTLKSTGSLGSVKCIFLISTRMTENSFKELLKSFFLVASDGLVHVSNKCSG